MRSAVQELLDDIRADLKPIAQRILRGEGDEFIDSKWRDIRDQIKKLAESAVESARLEKERDREERRQAKAEEAGGEACS